MICEEVLKGLAACAAGERKADEQLAQDAADTINLLLGMVEGLQERDTEEQMVFRNALHIYGADAQVMMLFEEMAELQKAICKLERNQEGVESVAEEIADVRIMLDQMEILFNCAETVKGERRLKVSRLRKRMDKELEKIEEGLNG